jgi:hypothetical protein
MIHWAFKQVRLGLPVDGSQDHYIKIKNFPDVQVGNWKDSQQPTKGGNEELQSDLTPEEIERLASEIHIDDDDVVDVDRTTIVYRLIQILGIASCNTLFGGRGLIFHQLLGQRLFASGAYMQVNTIISESSAENIDAD